MRGLRLTLVGLLLCGCTATAETSKEADNRAEGSCVAAIHYQGRLYLGLGIKRSTKPFEVGPPLKAMTTRCLDLRPGEVQVRRIKGFSPKVVLAIVSDRFPHNEVYAVADGETWLTRPFSKKLKRFVTNR